MEYALLLSLLAVVVILVVKMLGSRITDTHDNIQSQMDAQGVTDSAPQDPSSSSGGNKGKGKGHSSD